MKGLIRRLLFPPRCAACRELSDWYPESVALCENCQADWENQKGERCLICGARVCDCDCMTEEMKKAKCEALGKLAYYHPNTRKPTQNRLLYAIKEHKTRHNFAFLARELVLIIVLIFSPKDLLFDEVFFSLFPIISPFCRILSF